METVESARFIRFLLAALSLLAGPSLVQAYTHHVGAFAITGAVLGGFAFTSFRLTPAASNVYEIRFVERATASASTAIPHPASASACGHSVSRPTPFRKIARSITR